MKKTRPNESVHQYVNLLLSTKICCAPTVLICFSFHFSLSFSLLLLPPPSPSPLHSLFRRVMFRHLWRLSLSRQEEKEGMWRAEGERKVWQQWTCMPCGIQLSGERCSVSQNSTAALRYFTSCKCIAHWNFSSALVLSRMFLSSIWVFTNGVP